MKESTLSDNPNLALIETLKTYIKDARGADYAVMLTGDWGVGKTHLIRTISKENIGDKKPIYVSLFGVASKQDFDDAVIAAVYPLVNKKLAKVTSSAVKALGGFFRIKTDLKLTDILDTVQSGYFIFDDLERIAPTITTEEVLGFINRYVEHGECRVVIVGNEAEIKGKDAFRKIKEKIIGRTLQVKPETENALTAYLDAIENSDFKKFAITNRAIFERVYNQSKVNNLRILKQALWDAEQLFYVFRPEHQNFEGDVISTIRLLFVFALEAKKGNLTADDILNRMHALALAMRRKDKERELSNIEKLQEKHADIDINDTTLNNDCLKGMIFDGAFIHARILASLEESNRFNAPESEVEWKTVWYAAQRESEHVHTAAKEMERKYAAGEYLVPGVILHVFSQRLWLAELGMIADSEEGVIKSAKNYIDKLLSNGTLEPQDDALAIDRRWDSYEGLGFSNRNQEPFKEVAKHLRERQLQAYNLKLAEVSPVILDWLKNDIDRFVVNLLPNRGGGSAYGHVPILQFLDVDEFVLTLLGSSVTNQNEATMLFSNRYKHNLLQTDLADEKRLV